jgi:hypothetical protein
MALLPEQLDKNNIATMVMASTDFMVVSMGSRSIVVDDMNDRGGGRQSEVPFRSPSSGARLENRFHVCDSIIRA